MVATAQRSGGWESIGAQFTCRGSGFVRQERCHNEAEVSSILLRHEVHNSGDKGISSGVAASLAIDTETPAAELLGE
jgi:hypothetical protein